MTSARWRTSTSPAGNRPAAGDRWSGTAGAAAVPSGPVFQQPVCVLRTAAGPDQGAAAGGRRIRAAVQTAGRGRVPVATGPAGDAKIQLERNCLNVRSTSIGIEGKCKRGLFGTISLTLGNSTLPFRYGFVADIQTLCQLLLGHPLFTPKLCDQISNLCAIHSFSFSCCMMAERAASLFQCKPNIAFWQPTLRRHRRIKRGGAAQNGAAPPKNATDRGFSFSGTASGPGCGRRG